MYHFAAVADSDNLFHAVKLSLHIYLVKEVAGLGFQLLRIHRGKVKQWLGDALSLSKCLFPVLTSLIPAQINHKSSTTDVLITPCSCDVCSTHWGFNAEQFNVVN